MIANEERLRQSVKITRTPRDKGWHTTINPAVHDEETVAAAGEPASPHTSTESVTRSPTCMTSCTPRASAPPGGMHDQSLPDAPHVRRLRRYGMQPMVVINSHDQLPDLVIGTLARWMPGPWSQQGGEQRPRTRIWGTAGTTTLSWLK